MVTSYQIFQNTENFAVIRIASGISCDTIGCIHCGPHRDVPVAAMPRTKERGENARNTRRTMSNYRSTAVAFLLVAGIGFAASAAQGAAIVYEPFAFSDVGTQLEGNTGGTGLGTWDNIGTPQEPTADLAFGDLLTGGQAVASRDPSQGNSLWGRIRVPITADISDLLADGGEMWFSIRVAKPNSTAARLALAIGDSAASTNGNLDDEAVGDEQAIGGFLSRNSGKFHSLIWAQNSVSTNNLQSTSPTETTASDITLSAANNYSVLIVGHAEWGADGSATDTLTLYSPSSADVTSIGAVRAVSEGVVSQDSFDTLSLATGSNAGGAVYYDEIRIGATFEDVVPTEIPEPASLAMGLFGLTLIAVRRRRR
jgi:hypothetical protein